MLETMGRALIGEYGVLGLLLASSLFVIRWLLGERKRLHNECNAAREELRLYMLEQLRSAHQINAQLTERLEMVRGLRDKITSRKVVLHAQER